jgi:streptogramin lyase
MATSFWLEQLRSTLNRRQTARSRHKTPSRARPRFEVLEDRTVPSSFTEFPISTPNSGADGITLGSDGNQWFTQTGGNIGRITTTGAISEFPVYAANTRPWGITAGPDGNVWFALEGDGVSSEVGRVTSSGTMTLFPILPALSYPAITTGPDGNLWVTEGYNNQIAVVSPQGVLLNQFNIPISGAAEDIVAGPDGNLWFTEVQGPSGSLGPVGAGYIGRVSITGSFTMFPVAGANSALRDLTLGPDGNMWFLDEAANQAGRITPSGVITEFAIPTANSFLGGIKSGPDGNLWFAEESANQIARLTPTGVISEYPVPSQNSGPLDIVTGPDGKLWITENNANQIARFNPGPGPYVVHTTADSGPGSLRDAINQINADSSHTQYPSPSNPNVDEIDFNITAASDTGGGFNTGTGVATITPQSVLPIITNAMLLNGYSQAGASPNSLSQGDNAVLKVQVNGVSAGASANGLNISAANVTVQGLDVVSFGGNGIALTGSGGDTIQGNYVGTDITGTRRQVASCLVSYWSAEGNANDAVDGNNGTLVGYQPSDTTFAPGESGQAFNLDGTDDSISVPDAPSLDLTGSVSVDAWVNVGAFNPFESWIAGKTSKGGNYQLLLTSDGRAAFYIFNSGNSSYVGAIGSTHLTPGVFYNLAGTYDQASGNLSVYVNGALDGTNSVAPGTVDENTNNNFTTFQIGGLEGFGYPGDPQLFNGQIDDVSLYNRALAGTEVQMITNLKGAVVLSNATGIASYSPSNTIGGTTPAARNIVSGNSSDGMFIGGNSGTIQGNYVGIDASGSTAVGNGTNGIEVNGLGNMIGGTAPGAGNVVSGNQFGINAYSQAAAGFASTIQGNLIGTDASGTLALGNVTGIQLGTSSLVGGTSAAARNIISGNTGVGIFDAYAPNAQIEGNYIGTDISGTKAVAGEGDGIWLWTSGETVGGTALGAGNLISGSSNGGQSAGIRSFANNELIEGNLIGTDYTGTKAIANTIGIFFTNGGNSVVGGISAGSRNVISGNGNGIALYGSGNLIEGNYIGTDITGANAVPNSDGVSLGDTSTNNTIGGTTGAARNVISGNTSGDGFGVVIGTTSNNFVEGNYIGTDASGTYALGNGIGVWLKGSFNNTISGNVIAASHGRAGIGLEGFDSGPNPIKGNVIQGNFIGTDATGQHSTDPNGFSLGGNFSGVEVNGASGSYPGTNGNYIGGTAPGQGNIISGNNGPGIWFNGNCTSDLAQGNSISGNVGAGVEMDGNGIKGISILSNSIHDNAGLGIHLASGANDNQTAPVLTGLSGTAASPAISGNLTSVANTTFRIEFFANPLPGNLANTEGQTLLGSVYVTTNASGKATFTASGLAAIPVTANYLTATATVATPSGTSYIYGDTSQFSSYQKVSYFFGGFQAPLSQGLNFAVNRVIPVKFTLTDLTGAAVTSLAAVSSLQVAPVNSDGSLGTAFTPASTGNKGLTVSGSAYSFSWETKGLTAGSYAVVLTLADGTVQTRVIQLTKNGNSSGLTTTAAGGTGAAPGGLLGGNIDLYIDNSNGDLTADELARIQDAVTAADAVTEPYGVAVTEVTDPTLADVTLNMDTTSAVGGYADGVLGCTTDAGQITIINGWNFYAGSDATQIGSAQYDFETVVEHELGHALGLGHTTDSTSVMYATLNTGSVNRTLTTADLNVADSDTTGACGLHAANVVGRVSDPPFDVIGRDLLFAFAGAGAVGLPPTAGSETHSERGSWNSAPVDAAFASANQSPVFAVRSQDGAADPLFDADKLGDYFPAGFPWQD